MITLWTEPNDPLAYAPGLEVHHPIMSTLKAHGVQLERERYSSSLSSIETMATVPSTSPLLISIMSTVYPYYSLLRKITPRGV